MKILKHLFIYSFRWQLKSLIAVSILTIFLLLLIGAMPLLSQGIGFIFIYMLLLYPIFSVGNSLGNLGTNQNQFGSSFSGKYLLSLPIPKKNLIVYLMISNLFSLIPAMLTILWIAFFWDVRDFNVSPGIIKIISFIKDHIIISILFTVLGYFAFLVLQIQQGIEAPRKLYNKGTFQNLLLNIRNIFNFIIYSFILTMIFILIVFTKKYFIIPIALFVIVTWGIYGTYKTMINESLSYWIWKRDLIKMFMIVIVLGTTIGGGVYFMNTYKHIEKGSWVEFYSNGDTIFHSAMVENADEIEKYIKNNGPLDLTNKDGVSLIHVFSRLDFSKYKGIEEYFFKNPNLLLTQMHTKEKDCKYALYCEGLTPIHILSIMGTSNTLEKALDLNPELINVPTSQGRTPLHYSSAHCKNEATKVLIEHNADVNKVDSDSLTPLMEAARKECIPTSVLLLKAGANRELKNKKNQDALEIAQENKNEDLLFLIKNL